MATNGGPNIIEDGLVFAVDAANKKSYPGSGTTWTDLVGTNNGTLTNGPTFDPGNGGNIDFDGANDYVNVPNSTNLIPGSNNYSILFWAKYNGPALTSSSVIEGLFQKGLYTQTGGELQITFRGSSTYNGIYFRIRNSTSIDQVIPSTNISSNIGDGNFHHYACILDRSSNSLYLYFDGSLVGTDSGLNVSSITTTQNLHIGRYEQYYGQIQISNLSIYNYRALSASEISQNYNALKSRFGL